MISNRKVRPKEKMRYNMLNVNLFDLNGLGFKWFNQLISTFRFSKLFLSALFIAW